MQTLVLFAHSRAVAMQVAEVVVAVEVVVAEVVVAVEVVVAAVEVVAAEEVVAGAVVVEVVARLAHPWDEAGVVAAVAGELPAAGDKLLWLMLFSYFGLPGDSSVHDQATWLFHGMSIVWWLARGC